VSELATSLVSAGAALVGAGIGAYATVKARRPLEEELVLSRAGALLERQLLAFGQLLPLTEYGSEEAPLDLPLSERQERARRLTAWYYEEGAGLLLSGKSMGQYQSARKALEDPEAEPAAIRTALSGFRTALKIEIGIRDESERNKPDAQAEQRRRFDRLIRRKP
jgi:hypothetical protein